MSPSPSFVMPPRARHIVRLALPVALSAALLSTAVVSITPSSASAAGAVGTFTIGGTPVALSQPTDPEMGALTPSADAAQNGMFGSLAAWPIIPLHAAVARNGHLITWGTPIDTVSQSGVDFDDWDVSAGFARAAHTDNAAQNMYNSFCNAAVTLADGRLLMVSGQIMDGMSADMMTMLYDPNTGAQTMGATLAYERWYPTALRLTDNRILLLGGAVAGNTSAYLTPDDNSKVAFTPEIGTGTGAWTQLTGAASTALFGAVDNHWWYPRSFNAPNGGVVGFSGNAIWTLDPNGNGSVQQVGTLPYNPKVSGSQVMYAPGKILIAGGGQVNNDDPTTATNQTAMLDVTGATPVATSASPMNDARNWVNLTVLPTGTVFANGGTITGTQAGDANSVRQAEIWDPAASPTGGWTLAATAQRTRTYHSTSLLLPSGAVFTGGGGNPGPQDNFNAELYYPSYLFSKNANGTVGWASRPAITSIAGSATYGGTLSLGIGDGRTIASASLISLPAVTHSQNTDQRRIPLDVSQNGDTVTANLPGSVNTMPPGDYELTVVDAKGVPSAAQIVTIRSDGAGLVTVAAATQTPANTGGTVTGTAPAGGTGIPGATGTEGGTGTPTSGGSSATGAGTAPLPKAGTSVTLLKNHAVGLAPAARAGYRVIHTKSTLGVAKVTTHSRKALKTATSWIVRTGLGSKKGYLLESVDKPGYYLAAPLHGTGTLTLVKRSRSASFAKRATFTTVTGFGGHGVSFRETAAPSRYLQMSGSRLVAKGLTSSSSGHRAATFVLATGLASKR